MPIENAYANSQHLTGPPSLVCPWCWNKDPDNFATDSSTGDMVCLGVGGEGCGRVVVDHVVHIGQEKRNFEGEVFHLLHE